MTLTTTQKAAAATAIGLVFALILDRKNLKSQYSSSPVSYIGSWLVVIIIVFFIIYWLMNLADKAKAQKQIPTPTQKD